MPKKPFVIFLACLPLQVAFGACPDFATRYAKDQSSLKVNELIQFQNCITQRIVELLQKEGNAASAERSLVAPAAPAPAPVVTPPGRDNFPRFPGEPFVKPFR